MNGVACAQCGTSLTKRQLSNHAKFCSRKCYGLSIRLPLTDEERAEKAREVRRAISRRYYARHREKESARKRRYREEHREHYRELGKEWRRKNADHFSDLMKAWRERNPDYGKQWREANVDKSREYGRAWSARNPQKVADKASRRRARKRELPNEKIDRLVIYERDGGTCHICKKQVSKQNFTLDHLTPLARGGHHVALNVAVAHLSCNCRRGVDRLPAQLLLIG